MNKIVKGVAEVALGVIIANVAENAVERAIKFTKKKVKESKLKKEEEEA